MDLRLGENHGTLFAVEHQTVANQVQVAVPRQELPPALRLALLALGRDGHHRQLANHLDDLTFDGLQTPTVVLVVGGADDLPKDFADGFADGDRLRRLRLPVSNIGIVDWPARLRQTVRDLIRALDPAWRNAEISDPEAHLSRCIEGGDQSILLGHVLSGHVAREDEQQLRQWIDFLVRRCKNPPRRNFLLAFLCIEDTDGNVEPTLTQLLADGAPLEIVRLTSISKLEVDLWVDRYNRDTQRVGGPLAPGLTATLFGTRQALPHRTVFEGLKTDLLKSQHTDFFAAFGGAMTYG